MRSTALVIPLCAALAALASPQAGATSCDGPPWDPNYDRLGSYQRFDSYPVDVVFWDFRDCAYFDEPGGCTLTADGASIPVDAELVGNEACGLEYGDYEGDNSPDIIVRYVPTAPLTPGTTYVLDCEEGGPVKQSVTIRDGGASPPGSLADAAPHVVRGDDGCCAFGDYIELDVDPDAAFLREGGYVEARYQNGQVVAIADPEYGIDKLILPDTRGPLELTAVAADGSRGETVRFAKGDIPRELVYIPCTVTERPPPLALWLLAPLVWIGAHGRRRRAAASRAGGAS